MGGDIAIRIVCGRQVALVDADVEAGLLELLFDVNLALLHEREQVTAHPGDLGEREAVLCEIHGLAGEVRGGGVAFGRGGVSVGAEETVLELDSADGGVDL